MRPQRNARPGSLKEVSFSDEETDSITVKAASVVETIEDPNAIPIVTQNAKEFDLNHFKQYTKRIEYTNRDMFKIHDKNLRPKDQGSKDKGLVYVAFNSGMFEAIKKNMMRFLIDAYKVSLTKQPKIEYYGQAEERINLNIMVALNGKDQELKIKVYNTSS